jgi:hypothetical protein
VAYDAELDARVEEMAGAWGATRKRMFGGTCYMLEGHMMGGVSGDSLFVHLSPEEGTNALRLPNVRPFDISKNPLSGWVIIGPEGLDDDSLEDWLEQARDFVLTR